MACLPGRQNISTQAHVDCKTFASERIRSNHPLNRAKALSTSRRIASGRDGFGSGCAAIQESRRAKLSGGMRTANCVASILGRPRDFLVSDIDIIENI
jgi:hypothetical protein